MGEIQKKTNKVSLSGGWSSATSASFGVTRINAVSQSEFLHPMLVAVGDAAKIGYSTDNGDNWTQAQNGASPSSDIIAVHYDETDKLFIAVTNNAEILRSTNGIN